MSPKDNLLLYAAPMPSSNKDFSFRTGRRTRNGSAAEARAGKDCVHFSLLYGF